MRAKSLPQQSSLSNPTLWAEAGMGVVVGVRDELLQIPRHLQALFEGLRTGRRRERLVFFVATITAAGLRLIGVTRLSSAAAMLRLVRHVGATVPVGTLLQVGLVGASLLAAVVLRTRSTRGSSKL